MKKSACRAKLTGRAVVLLAGLLLSPPAFAQDDSASMPEVVAGPAESNFPSEEVASPEPPRLTAEPSPGRWNQLTADKAFSYRQQVEGAAPGKKEETSDGQSPRLPSGLLKGALVLLILAVAGAVLYNLAGKGGLFNRKSRRQVPDVEPGEADELSNLPPSELERRMQQAAASGDHRLAVRFGFLRTLQLLNEAGHIAVQPEKTNSVYAKELPAGNLRNYFRELRMDYERAWYGGRQPSAGQFEDFSSMFDRLKSECR